MTRLSSYNYAMPRQVLVPCGLSPLQRQYYKATLEKNLDFFRLTGGKRLLNIIMQLRKVANHPYVVAWCMAERRSA